MRNRKGSAVRERSGGKGILNTAMALQAGYRHDYERNPASAQNSAAPSTSTTRGGPSAIG